jgi:hypothetical protein
MGKKLILLAAAMIAAFVCYDWYLKNPPSYLAFRFHRSEKYYSRFADACTELIARVGKGQTNDYRIEGNDSRLPSTIKNARPTYLNVTKDRVQVVFELAASYGVVWDREEVDPKDWRLTIFGDAPPITVYSRPDMN